MSENESLVATIANYVVNNPPIELDTNALGDLTITMPTGQCIVVPRPKDVPADECSVAFSVDIPEEGSAFQLADGSDMTISFPDSGMSSMAPTHDSVGVVVIPSSGKIDFKVVFPRVGKPTRVEAVVRDSSLPPKVLTAR